MINKVIFLLFGQFLLTLLQLLLGNWGWPLPWVLSGAVYYAIAWGMPWGIFAGLLGGAVLGILYGGGWIYLNIMTYPLLAGLCGWWMERHDESREWNFWAPGLWVGIAAGLPAAAARITDWSVSQRWFPEAFYFAGRWIWVICVTMIVYYLVLACGEAANEFLGMPRFVRLSKGKQVNL